MFPPIFKYAVPFEGIAGYGRVWLVAFFGAVADREVIVVENTDADEDDGNFVLREVARS